METIESGAGIAPESLVEIYLRRSRHKDDRNMLAEGERDVRAWAAREGLTVRAVHVEEVSASKRHVKRPKYERACANVLAGKARTLAVWRVDRLDRRGAGAVDSLIDEFKQVGARMVATGQGLDSSRDRMPFVLLAEMARAEAENISVRTTVGHRAAKRAGKWPGGRAPYGLRIDKASHRLAPHPDTYGTARRIADALLAGRTPSLIAGDLNAEGIASPGGKSWRAAAIVNLAKNPAWAGLVPATEKVERPGKAPLWRPVPEPFKDDDGQPVSCGEGVVTPGEFARIRVLVGERTRSGAGKQRGKPHAHYLLTGLLHCGRCGGGMVHAGIQYRCWRREQLGSEACQGIATRADRIEDAVIGAWLAQVDTVAQAMVTQGADSPALLELARRWMQFEDPEQERQAKDTAAALTAARARLAKLEDDHYVHGRMTSARFDALWAATDEEIKRLEALQATYDPASSLAGLADAETVREAFLAAPVAEQRRYLAVMFDAVSVSPAKRPGDPTPMRDRLSYAPAA
ncbi:recombinase family protein [Streptacidiphilus sp. MAP12-33]|uniref:recombinase family protein n=1 Tax=Streptacidiphilus sp. MAP12-33 TaxID=3156266 RepID=UPI003512BF6A